MRNPYTQNARSLTVKWLGHTLATRLSMYSTPNIIRHIKSRRMRWTGHVARMGEESVQGFGAKARRKEAAWKTEA
jgi:hypothetical protein